MKKNSLLLRRNITAYSLLFPALAVYFMIILVPVGMTFINSFTKWNGISATKTFVGLSNYAKALADTQFQRAFKNNIIWTVFYVTIPVVLSLMIGMAITRKGMRGRDFFQAMYFIPYILSPVVVSIIWQTMFSPTVGMLSRVLQALGITSQSYGLLGDPDRALYGLIFTHIWSQLGFCIVIYVNGLQNVDPELYDAADIDGANWWQRLRSVTLPSLSSVTTLLILVNLMNSFKTFNYVFLMTVGGPMQRTEVVAYRIYVEAFQFNKFGYASAEAIILSVIVCIVGVFYVGQREKKENN